MIDAMIIDADICVKLGRSEKYKLLYEILPLVSKKIYMHKHAFGEVMLPGSAVEQLKALISEGKVQVVSESELDEKDLAVFEASYANLAQVMIDPDRPNKNKGETCSLAYAKATGIPFFATDERNLQPIIDTLLNTGINDIVCLRIIDFVKKARDGEIKIKRKYCKTLWAIAGKSKEIFDSKIWPQSST